MQNGLYYDSVPEIISYREAKRRGLKFYFTGEPCPHGHIRPRYVSAYTCVGCHDAIMATKRQQTKERRASRPLSARERAKAAGAARYKTRKPCCRGHFAERLTVNGACVECSRENRIKRDAENPAGWKKRATYRKANADRYRSHVRNRRAAAKGIDGAHTQDDVRAILASQGHRCAYCRKRLKKRYHVDHIKPLSRCGSNSRNNIQITCITCNLHKSSKDPIAYAQELGRLL
jgi:5-methylcytosine-specific restriction endonuclease McrA